MFKWPLPLITNKIHLERAVLGSTLWALTSSPCKVKKNVISQTVTVLWHSVLFLLRCTSTDNISNDS